MLFPKPDLEAEILVRVQKILTGKGVKVSMWDPNWDPNQPQPDLLLCLGGDGTVLHASSWAAARGMPVLGVNYGHLGYLTAFRGDEFEEAVDIILRGGMLMERRSRLMVEWKKDPIRSTVTCGLNEMNIEYRADRRMITLRVDVDGEELATYKANGLIVATATGSTAYSMAAGGPLLSPTLAAHIIIPICPHGLTTRVPMVVDANSTIDITCLSSDDREPMLLVDANLLGTPLTSHRITITKAKEPLLLCPSRQSMFKTMQEKFGWNGHT